MKPVICTAALAALAASLGSAVSIPHTSPKTISKRATGDLNIPSSGLCTNGISIGFLPSEGDAHSPAYTMEQINNKLGGAKAGAYGWYAQITGSKFDGGQLLAKKDDIVKSGAVFIASVMPSVPFSQVTADVAKQVAAVMKQFTDAGVEVWLRFGHEMNYYVQDGTYHGTAPEFVTAWKNIYDANCKGSAKVKCFWSPNQEGDVKKLQAWWPGQEYVDLVGIDCYARDGQNMDGSAVFEQFYGNFYDTFSKPYNLPFVIGETGAPPALKEGWLKQLVSQDRTKYPNYISMSWFEYDKEADMRIVMTDDATLQQTKKILLAGGSGTCGGGPTGGNGTQSAVPTQPTASEPASTHPPVDNEPATSTGVAKKPGNNAQCDWGCFGWDCSATSPCQQPWSCKGGYCK